MKSKKSLKFNKSSIRLLIELLLITVSIFVLTNTSGANYVFNSLFADAEDEEVTVEAAENVMETDVGYEVDIDTNTCTITSNVGLVQYSILYQTNPVAYQNVNIKIAISEGDLSNLPEFKSFGDVNYPFNANIIVAQSTDFSLTLDVPLFSFIYDSSRICDSTDNDKIVSIIKASDASASTPLFAENVVKNNENKTPAKWIIGVGDCQDKCSGIIGNIGEGAAVDITVTATGSSINITNDNNAGFICQTMVDGSSLTVNMPQAIAYNVTSASGYAGGLVGYAKNAEITTIGSVSISGTVSGVLGAGGVVGYFESNQGGTYELSNYSINCTLSAANPDAATTGNANSGGVFGVLKNNKKADDTCNEMIITNVGTDNIKPIINSSGNCNCGGLIGNYSSDDVGNSITVRGGALNVSLNNASADTTTYYGGIIGMIDDDSYVKFESTVKVNAANCSGKTIVNDSDVTAANSIEYTTVFGGLVGFVDKAFIDAADVVICSGAFSDSGVFTGGSFTGGGVVGEMKGGVLRLSGTTDLSAATAVGGGQIVGTRGNQSFIYAADGWELIRSSTHAEYDDIGTWGEVLRFNSSTFTEDSVLNKGVGGHTVTIPAASTTVNTLADFAKLALNIQMNDGTASDSTLIFADMTNSTSEKLLGSTSTITLNCDIDLSGTGITGLTRDDGTNAPFTGKFVGNSHTIKLATGELYGYRENNSTLATAEEDGNGNIHRHLYSGLFAKTSDGAEFNGLTVSGNITVKYKNDSEIYCIGGLSALHVNDINNPVENNKFTAENITVTETIDHSGNGGTYHFVGGMVGGFDQFSNAYITMTDCTFKPYINDTSSSSKLLCAGAIGEIRESRNVVITATDITLSATVINKNSMPEKRAGGFISNIANFNGTAGTRTMQLDKITIDGASVTSTSADNGVGGALLGESWNNMNVIIGGNGNSGITVKNSTVTYNGNDHFAGLVTIATGYWQVHSIDIQSGNVFSDGYDDTDDTHAKSFGLLVNKGRYQDNGKNLALYLELRNKDAYKLDSSVTISIGEATVFDELVATCHGNYDDSSKDNIMRNNNCAIVSIHTDGDIVTMNGTNSNTYKNRTGRDMKNPNTRYYYNLDVLRAKSELTDSEKLMLWSVNVYAFNNLKDYFYNAFTDNVIPAGEYNMTGYSYYPVDISSGITIENGCNFTFANDKITADTVSSTSQHYLMHCGLFRNVTGNMTVSNVSFGGSIGQSSGALVCGTIWGSDAQHIATSAIDGVTLDGIAAKGAESEYAPLLINKIGSNTSFSLSNVRTTEKYASGSIAASSLVGDVGGDNADNIQILFNSIVLDGRNKTGVLSDLDGAYNTTRSIFNRATLLNSFKYPSGKVCNAVYNYKIAEDWEDPWHQVTYGKEVSRSDEYTGEGKQKWYVDSAYYTSPESAQAESEYNFSTDFLPYVYTPYVSDDTNNIAHEIKINHQGAAKLDEGCGTYNDPYIIRTPAQLLLVADILNNSPEDGVAINYTDDTVNNYKTWCEDKSAHTLLTYSSSESVYVSEDDTVSVSKDTIKQAVSTAYYMLAGDIEISKELAEEKNFQGIGYNEPFKGVIYGADHKITNKTTKPLIYQSVGVVVKDLTVEVTADFSKALKDNANSKYYTDGDGKAEFYGGLIGIVNGGDNIIDKVSVTITKAKTIKPEIKLDGKTIPSCYGNKAIGGYIGVVRYGGVIFRNMDGIEHSGITEGQNSSFKSTGDFKNSDGKILLYCNPIIGRVIDGFAVTESDAFRPDEASVTMQNGTKNYSIADINKNAGKTIEFSDIVAITDNRSWETYISTITVPDSQSLFLLGCITMSGAGKLDVTHNVYYTDFELTGYGKKNGNNTYQMVRHGDYSGTLDDFNNNIKYFDKFSRDGGYNNNFNDNKDKTVNDVTIVKEVVPYLTYKYATESVSVSGENKSGTIYYPARTLTSNGSVFKIELAENGQYILPDGFRGIGSLNTSKDNSQMYIYSLKGNGSTIKLNMNFYKYRNDYDQYYKCNSSQNYYVGLGLFNTLIQNKRDFLLKDKSIDNVYDEFPDYKVSDMTITGIVNMVSYNDEKAAIKYDDYMSCAGGLAGAISSNEGNKYFAASIDNVDLLNLTVNSSHIAGGLAGFVKGHDDNNLSKVKIKNCSAQTVSVDSGYYAGGLVGFIKQCEFSIDGTTETGDESLCNNIRVYTAKDYNNSNYDKQLGIGGMIGTALTKCKLDISNIKIENSDVNSEGGLLALGGVVGYNYNNTRVKLENVNVKNVDIHKDKEKSKIYSGGLIGRVYMDSSDKTVALDNCHVEGSGGNIIYGSAQGSSNVGGLIGWIYGNAAATVNVNNCSVDSYVISSTSSTDTCGGFIGKSEVDVSLTNSKISGCTVQGAAGASVGGLVGYCSNGGINGYNIVSDKVHITDKDGKKLSSSTDGDIAGSLASGKTINLVGVCVYKDGEDLYSDASIGKKDGTGYIIYSDYSGACIDEMSANKTASNIIEYTNNISTMGSLPYATVNPKVKIGIEAEPKFLTSDGAYIGAAANIIAGINNINGYKNISDDAEAFDTSYKDKLSTFNEKTGAGVSNNFPVLVINDSDPQNITDMLNSYIHILTNDSSISNYASDGGSKYNVEIIPFRLNSTSNIFETQSSFAKTLKSNNTYFKMTDEDYDSNHSQFSLIDIQYYDPTTADDPQIVYHLYIPVYVEKMLKFNFTVGALSGTTYNTQNYINGKPVMENYGTPITAHITYSYLRTVQEWERAINSGENLLQGYGKSVVLKQMDNLAGDTRLVLVDKNNFDKAYYSTMGEAFDTDTNKLVFSKFFTSGSTAFQPVSFMDLLSRSAEISMESNSDGTLVKCGEDDTSLATIKISNNGNVEYYRKRTETDNDTSNLFSAKVTAKDSTVDPSSILAVDEEYYITFFTIAKDADKMSNIILTCDSRLEDSGMIPSRMNNDDKNDPKNERLIHMIIGNLFVQSFSFQTTNTSQLITEANKTITANLLTEIKWKDENQKADMQSYLKNSSIHLYHSFIVEATTTDGETNEKGVKGNPQVSGTYKVGEKTYNININNNDSIIKIGDDGNGGVVDIKDILIENDTVTITCDDLKIEYPDDVSIIAQFPQRKQGGSYGTKYSASSNLAYVTDNIEHSNMFAAVDDDETYYREDISSASLVYNIPAISANDFTVLGINGREANDKINAVAYYNVKNIPEADLNKASYVKFTLSLYQKDNYGNYTQVDVGTYLEEVRLYYEGSGENNMGYASPDETDSYTFTFAKDDLTYDDGLFEVKTSFDVKTGAEFESGNLTYANYKVVLTAELLDDTKAPIENSSCQDYIIYTNAKICTDMLAA